MIADYINGNVHITLDDDGTRIMECPDNEAWDFEYPTNIDMTITKSCTGRCQYCYLGCTPNGKHADLLSYRNIEIFDSLLPGTEVAINLNSCDHPQLFHFSVKPLTFVEQPDLSTVLHLLSGVVYFVV